MQVSGSIPQLLGVRQIGEVSDPSEEFRGFAEAGQVHEHGHQWEADPQAYFSEDHRGGRST